MAEVGIEKSDVEAITYQVPTLQQHPSSDHDLEKKMLQYLKHLRLDMMKARVRAICTRS